MPAEALAKAGEGVEPGAVKVLMLIAMGGEGECGSTVISSPYGQ